MAINTTKFSVYANTSNSLHYVFTWIFVMLFLLILMIIFLKTLDSANKKISSMQQNNLEELKMLVEEKNIEIIELRSKLAQDFHDEVSNKLAGIRIISETIGIKSDRNVLEKVEMLDSLQMIETRSKELYQDTKDFIWSIGSNSDKVIEFYYYLSNQLHEYYNQKNIHFETAIFVDKTSNNLIAPTVSRQLVIIINEISIQMSKYFSLSALEADFRTIKNDLFIKLNFTFSEKNSSMNYDLPLQKVANRLFRIQATANQDVAVGSVAYTIKVKLYEN